MATKPKREELQEALKTLIRWNAVAKAKNKMKAVYETQKIYDMLKYLEQTTDFRL